MRNLAIIPARGGSKRIFKKNIKDFLGKPIIAYSIEAAIKSELFDEVMVSTDDNEIADIAIKFGAKVPILRSENSSNDYATLAEVMREVTGYYKKQQKLFDYCCCILPTAPLIKIENLKKGLDLLIQKGFDSVKPVVRFSYPIQRALKLEGNKVSMISPQYLNARSQDLVDAYHDAAQFYWFCFDKGLIGDNKGAIILKNKDVQDIDTLDDWELAILKYKHINSL